MSNARLVSINVNAVTSTAQTTPVDWTEAHGPHAYRHLAHVAGYQPTAPKPGPPTRNTPTLLNLRTDTSPSFTTENSPVPPKVLSPATVEEQPSTQNVESNYAIDDSQLSHLVPTLQTPTKSVKDSPALTAVQPPPPAYPFLRRSFIEALLAIQKTSKTLRDNRASTLQILNPINHSPKTNLLPIHNYQDNNRQPDAEDIEIHSLLTIPEQLQARPDSITLPYIEHTLGVFSILNNKTSVGLPSNTRRGARYHTQKSRMAADTSKKENKPKSLKEPDAPEKAHVANGKYSSTDRDLEANTQGASILGSNYGVHPSDQPAHPPRRVSSQKSLKRVRSAGSLKSSIHNGIITNNEVPPPLPPQWDGNFNYNLPRSSTHNSNNPDAEPNNANAGDDTSNAEDLAWGPSHPCFPHPNSHVPLNSPEYESTRLIRIKRDWMIVGDLAPTFSNIYPEILDPLVSESEFRLVLHQINSTLVEAYDPFSTLNWLDGIMGVLTGWFWEDFRTWGAKGKLKGLEKWIEGWNHDIGAENGVKIIPLRRTGYMNIDIQIPDPQVKLIKEGQDDNEQRRRTKESGFTEK